MFLNRIKYKGIVKNHVITETDLIKFNAKIKTLEDLEEIIFKKGHLEVRVDFQNTQIFVNNKLVVREENIKNISYVNFRRKNIDFSFEGNINEEIKGHGIGFKGEREGKKIKIYVFVEGNKYKIVKE